MTGARVRFRFRYNDTQVATYDHQAMTCVPRVGDAVKFADRQVVVESVTWNMDPAIPADVIVEVV